MSVVLYRFYPQKGKRTEYESKVAVVRDDGSYFPTAVSKWVVVKSTTAVEIFVFKNEVFFSQARRSVTQMGS